MPTELGINIGDTVAFNCKSYGETIWFFRAIKMEPIFTSNPLILARVSVNDSGYYYCYGLSKNKKTFLSKALLKVYGKCDIYQFSW